MECVVCGGVSEFDIVATGAVFMRCLEGSLYFSPPTSSSRSESKGEDSILEAETRKAVKRSSGGVQV